jgi:hypothetical protein
MPKFQTLFEYDESVNDAITIIQDYLRDNATPGQPKVTRVQALRYAVIMAAMRIQAEKIVEPEG